MAALTRPFRDISKADVALAGGKGASLGEMTRAGIPVPPGYVVITDAFRRFVDENKLQEEITGALKKFKPHDPASAEALSVSLRNAMLKAEMPDAVRHEVLEHFTRLKCPFLADRSSATAEDTGKTSWAGELESYLNTTEDNLLENVKLCWSSLFTPRALHYRSEHGLLATDIAVAVVVQKMVNSDTSGIAFTVHPVTKDYDQLVIEAAFGLG